MKLSRTLILLLIGLIISSAIGCVPHGIGGPCGYKEIYGTATITSIVNVSAGSQDYNCPKNPVIVRFDFVSDDPNASFNPSLLQGCPNTNRTLIVGAGMNPSAEYMVVKGITVGSSYRCKRMEETKGSCTPVIFNFYEMNFSDYGEYCW